MTKVES